MKKLKETVDLQGQIEEISMMDLRKAPGEVFVQVECGKVFVILWNGKPRGYISRLPGELIQEIDTSGKVHYKNPESVAS